VVDRVANGDLVERSYAAAGLDPARPALADIA
jgi:hypothetical protein